MKQKPIRPLGVGDKCIIISDHIKENIGKKVVIVARLHRCESCSEVREALFDCDGEGLINDDPYHKHACFQGVSTNYRTLGKYLQRIDDNEQEPLTRKIIRIEETI